MSLPHPHNLFHLVSSQSGTRKWPKKKKLCPDTDLKHSSCRKKVDGALTSHAISYTGFAFLFAPSPPPFCFFHAFRCLENFSEGSYLSFVSEGMGKTQDWEMVMKYQGKDGSIMNSPSATAAALSNL